MRVRQSYSREFKDAIVSKIMNRGNQTIEEICEREGVADSPLPIGFGPSANVIPMTKQKTSKKWSAQAKLKAINETHAMSEEELGAYLCREDELNEWREEVNKGLAPAARKTPAKKDERDEKIKSLERELRRKDKAIAEASALLILQKKST